MTHLFAFFLVFVSFLAVFCYRWKKLRGRPLPVEAGRVALLLGLVMLLVSVAIARGACHQLGEAISLACAPAYKSVGSMAMGAALVVLGLAIVLRRREKA